jgi:hypothetical protein
MDGRMTWATETHNKSENVQNTTTRKNTVVDRIDLITLKGGTWT